MERRNQIKYFLFIILLTCFCVVFINISAQAADAKDIDTQTEEADISKLAVETANFVVLLADNVQIEENIKLKSFDSLFEISEIAKKGGDLATELQEYYDWQEYQVYITELRQNLVDYACSFEGWLPYVWGGTSLSTGADCCGFTWAIYQSFGIDIPRVVETQAKFGRSVPIEEIEPGDIIIYSGHVALYVGDGLKVHEPSPGRTVSVDSIYNMPIIDIRRIIE